MYTGERYLLVHEIFKGRFSRGVSQVLELY